MIIKIKIKEVRESKKMSLRELEQQTGIDRKYLADVENNKIPADEILFAEMVIIATALGVSILEIYETENIEIEGIGEF